MPGTTIGDDAPELLDEVKRCSDALQQRRHEVALARARLEAAMAQTRCAGGTQTAIAHAASVSQPYVSQVLADREGRFMPQTRLGCVLVANRWAVADTVRKFGADHVRVFGSVARGEDVPGSDIDLLIDVPSEMGLFSLARLQADLQSLLGEPVDVVASRLVKPSIRSDVERHAVPL